MYEIVRQIWGEERRPEEWKETIIVPIHKRGDGSVRITGECSLQNFVEHNNGKN